MVRQTAVESNLAQVQASATLQECTPPPVCHDFQTARLFLSHFGLLSLDEVSLSNNWSSFIIQNQILFHRMILKLDHISLLLIAVIQNFVKISLFLIRWAQELVIPYIFSMCVRNRQKLKIYWIIFLMIPLLHHTSRNLFIVWAGQSR